MERKEFTRFRKGRVDSPISSLDGFRLDPNQIDEDLDSVNSSYISNDGEINCTPIKSTNNNYNIYSNGLTSESLNLNLNLNKELNSSLSLSLRKRLTSKIAVSCHRYTANAYSNKNCNNDSDSEDEYRNLIDVSTKNPSTVSSNTNTNNCNTNTNNANANNNTNVNINLANRLNSQLSLDSEKPKAKKKSSLGMISDLNWSKRVGNFEVLRNQQILYKLIQKHSSNSMQVNHTNMR